MATIFRKIFTLVAFNLVMLSCLFAQPGNPGGNPDVPISGIELIIGLGGLYGFKKLLGKSKK